MSCRCSRQLLHMERWRWTLYLDLHLHLAPGLLGLRLAAALPPALALRLGLGTGCTGTPGAALSLDLLLNLVDEPGVLGAERATQGGDLAAHALAAVFGDVLKLGRTGNLAADLEHVVDEVAQDCGLE